MTPSRPASGSTAPRGFTFFEVIIAIVLMLALASLAMPVISNRRDARTLDAAVARSSAHILLARAFAQATGEPVEILYDGDRGAWLARRFVVDATVPALGARGHDPSVDPLGFGAEVDHDDDPDDERVIAEAWALESLPRRVRVSFIQPEAVEALPSGPAGVDDLLNDADVEYELPDDEFGGFGAARALERFVIILPDGTALLRRTAWIVSRDGRATRIEVNPWNATLVTAAVEVPPEGEDDDLAESADEDVETRGETADADAAPPRAARDDESAGAPEDPSHDGSVSASSGRSERGGSDP